MDETKNDRELIAKEREELKLTKPLDFEKSRITPEHIAALIPLLTIPFNENDIVTRERDDFTSKGVPLSLQLMRLYDVFGTEHVKFEHRVAETDIVKNQNKSDMYYYKVYVKLSIGNWTLYNENNCKPSSTFISYYEIDGIGYGGHTSKGTAEKNAVANGKKECLKNMGLLSYLYLEEECNNTEDTEGDDFKFTKYPNTKIQLLEQPVINDKGKIFLRGRAKDLTTNSEVEVIVYRDNPQMLTEHKVMIDTLLQYKQSLTTGRELSIEYKEGNVGRPQYIIRKVFFKK